METNEQFAIDNEASQFWSSFVEEVTHHNRFYPNHPLLPFLSNYLETHASYLEANTILYRARTIDYERVDAECTGFVKFIHHEDYGAFEGYDEKNSYVPPSSIVPAGRANPEQIAYLYATKEIITAIGEIRPRIFDHISVAKIQLLKRIRLADLTGVDESSKSSLEHAKIAEIVRAFSKPSKSALDYVPTQYIAEYIKALGFDGLAFNSSFVPGGTNVTIYDPGSAKAIASAPYRMDMITYRARRIFPMADIEAFDIIATNAKEE